MVSSITIKKNIQDLAIFLLVLSGIRNIIMSIPWNIRLVKKLNSHYANIHTQTVQINIALSIVTGFLILILAYKLYKRMYIAWIIEIITISISLCLYISRHKQIITPVTIGEAFIIIVLAYGYKDFSRRSNRITAKKAIMLSSSFIILILINATVGLFMMKNNYKGIEGLEDALYTSAQMLFFMEPSVAGYITKSGEVYANSIITLNWICIVISTLTILKPLIYNPIITNLDKQRARKLVKAYGDNPIAYLALENDKKYFFGNTVEGVVAFTVVAEVAVCCGDIICEEKNGKVFLDEFITFCNNNGWSINMLDVTGKFLSIYKSAGFGHVKYGEDAMFKLSEYNLAGGKVAKVRAAINHAIKAGIYVEEYKPNESKNHHIEKEINEVSKQWLAGKKSSELSFMLGGVGLENPMDKRYFIAYGKDHKIMGFVVFIPFEGGNGYLADITRRLPNAPQGVLEKIIYDAFMLMKEEGIQWGSLGLVPLVNVRKDDNTIIAGRLFEFIYENLNNMYGFKALYRAKLKYAPTNWETRYMVYLPAFFTHKIAYSIVKAQNPKGISDYILSQLKQQKTKNQ